MTQFGSLLPGPFLAPSRRNGDLLRATPADPKRTEMGLRRSTRDLGQPGNLSALTDTHFPRTDENAGLSRNGKVLQKGEGPIEEQRRSSLVPLQNASQSFGVDESSLVAQLQTSARSLSATAFMGLMMSPYLLPGNGEPYVSFGGTSAKGAESGEFPPPLAYEGAQKDTPPPLELIPGLEETEDSTAEETVEGRLNALVEDVLADIDDAVAVDVADELAQFEAEISDEVTAPLSAAPETVEVAPVQEEVAPSSIYDMPLPWTSFKEAKAALQAVPRDADPQTVAEMEQLIVAAAEQGRLDLLVDPRTQVDSADYDDLADPLFSVLYNHDLAKSLLAMLIRHKQVTPEQLTLSFGMIDFPDAPDGYKEGQYKWNGLLLEQQLKDLIATHITPALEQAAELAESPEATTAAKGLSDEDDDRSVADSLDTHPDALSAMESFDGSSDGALSREGSLRGLNSVDTLSIPSSTATDAANIIAAFGADEAEPVDFLGLDSDIAELVDSRDLIRFFAGITDTQGYADTADLSIILRGIQAEPSILASMDEVELERSLTLVTDLLTALISLEAEGAQAAALDRDTIKRGLVYLSAIEKNQHQQRIVEIGLDLTATTTVDQLLHTFKSPSLRSEDIELALSRPNESGQDMIEAAIARVKGMEQGQTAKALWSMSEYREAQDFARTLLAIAYPFINESQIRAAIEELNETRKTGMEDEHAFQTAIKEGASLVNAIAQGHAQANTPAGDRVLSESEAKALEGSDAARRAERQGDHQAIELSYRVVAERSQRLWAFTRSAGLKYDGNGGLTDAATLQSARADNTTVVDTVDAIIEAKESAYELAVEEELAAKEDALRQEQLVAEAKAAEDAEVLAITGGKALDEGPPHAETRARSAFERADIEAMTFAKLRHSADIAQEEISAPLATQRPAVTVGEDTARIDDRRFIPISDELEAEQPASPEAPKKKRGLLSRAAKALRTAARVTASAVTGTARHIKHALPEPKVPNLFKHSQAKTAQESSISSPVPQSPAPAPVNRESAAEAAAAPLTEQPPTTSPVSKPVEAPKNNEEADNAYPAPIYTFIPENSPIAWVYDRGVQGETVAHVQIEVITNRASTAEQRNAAYKELERAISEDSMHNCMNTPDDTGLTPLQQLIYRGRKDDIRSILELATRHSARLDINLPAPLSQDGERPLSAVQIADLRDKKGKAEPWAALSAALRNATNWDTRVQRPHIVQIAHNQA